MFKLIVILVHALLFVLSTLIGLVDVMNPSPEPGKSYEVLFLAIVIYNIVVLISIYIQFKVKKVWLFVASVVVLIILFFYLPEIILYFEGIA